MDNRLTIMSNMNSEADFCREEEVQRLRQDINTLNARLLERQVAFNEADKRRLARIAELEEQLRLANVEINDLRRLEHQLRLKGVELEQCHRDIRDYRIELGMSPL